MLLMNTKEKAILILNKLAAVNLPLLLKASVIEDQLDDTLNKLFQVRTQQDAVAILQQHGQQP